jgi:hypothetical protein
MICASVAVIEAENNNDTGVVVRSLRSSLNTLTLLQTAAVRSADLWYWPLQWTLNDQRKSTKFQFIQKSVYAFSLVETYHVSSKFINRRAFPRKFVNKIQEIAYPVRHLYRSLFFVQPLNKIRIHFIVLNMVIKVTVFSKEKRLHRHNLREKTISAI